MEWGANILSIIGTALAVVGVILTWIIFTKQEKDSQRWQEEIRDRQEDTHKIVAELRASQVENDTSLEPQTSDTSSSVGASRPTAENEYVAELKAKGFNLDWNNLHWARKTTCDGGRGNLGWFVDDGGDERFFIHRGRVIQARRAIPRAYVNAWRDKTKLDLCNIRLDYRSGEGKGNHAWLVTTYNDETWRISKGGRGSEEFNVTRVTS